MTLRSLGLMLAVVAFFMGSGVRLSGAPEDVARPAVFVTLPMTKGFVDATQALVDAQTLVRDALSATGEVRLVPRAEDADVVLTVRGRGRGDLELTTALRALDDDVSASSIAIATNERYIEATVAVGTYQRAFVGLGLSDRDSSQRPKKPLSNSWEACAAALARDLRAWLNENSTRILALR